MNPRLREVLALLASSAVAILGAIQLAQGNYFVPALAATVAVGFILSRAARLEIDTIFVGLVVIGYLVGCRGFAQISLVPGLPLLPAEAALGLAVTWRVIRVAFEKRLPWSGDPVDRLLLIWLVLGTARVAFDVPRHGFLAIRDYAMVYYALFYFMVRFMARDAAARRYLLGCLVAGLVGLACVYPLTEVFPDFFRRQLLVGQVPLIHYKDDIVKTFFAAGGILLFHLARGRWRLAAVPLAVAMFLAAMVSDVRAAFVGGVAALAMLGVAGRWRFTVIQGCLATFGAGVLVVAALAFDHEPAKRGLVDITARVATIAQIDAFRAHQLHKGYKVDNNRFRLVWWRTVATDVWERNPWFGLGFGYDLSARFVQEYDQEMGEEFVARSPHSVAVSVLGRMGLVGFAVWLAFGVSFVQRARQGVSRARPATVGLWGALIVVATSSLFGVVLEGPMGAVPFWVMLALASSPEEGAAATAPSAVSVAEAGAEREPVAKLPPAAGPAKT